MSTEFELEPGVEVAGRYRIIGRLPSDGPRRVYRALDTACQKPVVLFRVSEAEAALLVPIVDLEHPHLARVIGVPALDDGGRALVCELVDGPRLDAVLENVGHETPVEAVRSALRIADALSAIHQAGGVHGLVHPASVIVAPHGRKAPLLGFAPMPAASPFRSSPTPSVADDAWAMSALLYCMLVGEPPPPAGFEAEAPLEAAGIADPVLRAAVLRGLHADERRRGTELTPLRRELARWYVDRASDEQSEPTKGSLPPPLPGMTRAAIASRRASSDALERRRSRRLLGVAVAAFVAAIGAAWGLSSALSRRVRVVEVPSVPSAGPPVLEPSSASPRIDLSEVKVSGDAGPSDEASQCVSGLLPQNTFGAQIPDFSWLCSEQDPRMGALRLKSALVAGRPPVAVTEAMRIASRLGWFELVSYGLVYRACCAEAPTLELPDPGAGCARIDALLERTAKDVLAERSIDDEIAELGTAFDCEARAGRSKLFWQKGRPRPPEQAAFRELVRLIRSPR